MSWFFTILFISLTFCGLSEAEHHQKKHHTSAAVVVGTVYCDTCFQQDFSKNSHFIPGASVTVKCKDENFKKQVKTNEHGEFKVALPFTVSKHVKKIERCSVELVSSSEPFCAVASSATSSSLHLKARKEGVHVFSAGFFTFKPLKQPVLCNQKPSVQGSNNLSNKKTSTGTDTGIGTSKDIPFPPPLQDPPVPGVLPPLPLLPKLPPLPELPLLPPLQKPNVQGSSDLSNKKIDTGTDIGASKDIPLPPPIQDPPVPGLMPPLPVLPKLPPLPELPLLPPLPKLPNLPPMPWTKSQTVDQKVAQPDNFPPRLPTTIFPPFPFLPPPIPVLQPPPILPPNPLLPPPAPLIPIPPNPLQPPPSPLIPIPPVPGLTPSPPPPAFPIPLPPFRFPRPSFPGIPPASTTP